MKFNFLQDPSSDIQFLFLFSSSKLLSRLRNWVPSPSIINYDLQMIFQNWLSLPILSTQLRMTSLGLCLVWEKLRRDYVSCITWVSFWLWYKTIQIWLMLCWQTCAVKVELSPIWNLISFLSGQASLEHCLQLLGSQHNKKTPVIGQIITQAASDLYQSTLDTAIDRALCT